MTVNQLWLVALVLTFLVCIGGFLRCTGDVMDCHKTCAPYSVHEAKPDRCECSYTVQEPTHHG